MIELKDDEAARQEILGILKEIRRIIEDFLIFNEELEVSERRTLREIRALFSEMKESLQIAIEVNEKRALDYVPQPDSYDRSLAVMRGKRILNEYDIYLEDLTHLTTLLSQMIEREKPSPKSIRRAREPLNNLIRLVENAG